VKLIIFITFNEINVPKIVETIKTIMEKYSESIKIVFFQKAKPHKFNKPFGSKNNDIKLKTIRPEKKEAIEPTKLSLASKS
jgi:hypothetical protein